MVELGPTAHSHGLEMDVVSRNMDVCMNLGRGTELALEGGGERQGAVGLGESSQDKAIFAGNVRKDNDISEVMGSLRLPSELMSFALTYEKAYCSSLFLGDCWTADRTLSNIGMPTRIRPPKTPKPKLGCLTCKVRRVKCDELKPTCLRCQKMRLKCGGYSTPKRDSTRSLPVVLTRQPVTPKLALLHPHPLPKLALFHTSRDYQYFKVFSDKVLREGKHKMFLQICQSEPLLRRAVIVLVALEKMRAALSVPEDATANNNKSLDLTIEHGEQNPDTAEQIETSRQKLLGFLCLAYCKKILGNHGSGSSKRCPQAMSIALREWSTLFNQEQSRSSTAVPVSLVGGQLDS